MAVQSTRSLKFDGSTGYVTFTRVTLPGAGWSVSWWQRLDLSSLSQPIIGDTVSTSNLIYFSITNYFLVRDNVGGQAVSAVAAAQFPGNLWTHWAITNSVAGCLFYKNGVLIETQAQLGVFTPNCFGNQDGLAFLKGGLDDVAFFTSALSGATVAGIAAGTTDVSTLSPAYLWRLEEGGGTNTADTGGGANNGTLTGGVTWAFNTPLPLCGVTAAGRWVGAVQPRELAGGVQSTGSLGFDGTGYISTSSGSGVITNRLSVSCWVKTTTAGRGDLVTCWISGGTNDQFNLLYSSGLPTFYVQTGATSRSSGTGSTSLADGDWHHVCGTFDGSHIRVYLDGVLQSTGNFTITLNTASLTPIRLGNNSYGDGALTGSLDDAAVFDFVLTPTQIAAIAGTPGVPGSSTLDVATLSPLGLWRLDDGSGFMAFDSSGNFSSGSLNGGVAWSYDAPLPLSTWSAGGRWVGAVQPLTPVPTSSLTAVGLNNTYLWKLLAAVGASRLLKWNDRILAGKQDALKWNDRVPAGKQDALLWNDWAAAGLSRRLSWGVAAAVGKQDALLWNDLVVAGLADVLLWNDRVRAGKQDALLWNDRAAAGLSRRLPWGVAAAVGKQDALLWNAAAAVALLQTAVWNDRSSVGKRDALLWGDLAAAGLSDALLWADRSKVGVRDALLWDDASVAAVLRAVLWNDRAAVGLSDLTLWNDLRAVGRQRTALWDVLSTTVADVNFTLLWDALAAAGVSRTALWNVRVGAGRNASPLWGDLVSVPAPRIFRWADRALAGKADATLWGVNARAGVSRADVWGVRALVRKNASPVWDDLVAAAVQEALAWADRGLAGHPGRALWGVNALAGASRAARWNDRRVASVLRSLDWRDLVAVGRADPLAWNDLGLAGDSARLLWRALADQTSVSVVYQVLLAVLQEFDFKAAVQTEDVFDLDVG